MDLRCARLPEEDAARAVGHPLEHLRGEHHGHDGGGRRTDLRPQHSTHVGARLARHRGKKWRD